MSGPKGELDYRQGGGLLQPFTSTNCIANVNSIDCECCDLLLEVEPDDRGAVGMCGWVQFPLLSGPGGLLAGWQPCRSTAEYSGRLGDFQS